LERTIKDLGKAKMLGRRS
jgi:hypothetical protein